MIHKMLNKWCRVLDSKYIIHVWVAVNIVLLITLPIIFYYNGMDIVYALVVPCWIVATINIVGSILNLASIGHWDA